MARIRTVKPELFRHEALYEAEKRTKLPLRLSFIGLFTIADRRGRFKWRPRELVLDVLPFDKIDFAKVINALLEAGFIQKYVVDGKTYGHIPSWELHQSINNRERESVIPPPSTDLTREPRVDDASERRLVLYQGEGNRMEGNGTGKDIDATDVTLLFDFWQETMQYPQAKLDDKRKRKIQSALKLGFSVEQLKTAILGCANTPFNMGNNQSGKKYNGIDLIFRDAEHIERFIQNASNKTYQDENHSPQLIHDIFAGAI